MSVDVPDSHSSTFRQESCYQLNKCAARCHLKCLLQLYISYQYERNMRIQESYIAPFYDEIADENAIRLADACNHILNEKPTNNRRHLTFTLKIQWGVRDCIPCSIVHVQLMAWRGLFHHTARWVLLCLFASLWHKSRCFTLQPVRTSTVVYRRQPTTLDDNTSNSNTSAMICKLSNIAINCNMWLVLNTVLRRWPIYANDNEYLHNEKYIT